MRIERVEIKGFGKIRNLVIAPGSGLNIIYGANEAGKSTVQRFIRAMFYGLRSGRQSVSGLPPSLKRFMPWDGAVYGGSITYTLDDGSTYRVERNFDKNTVRIYDVNYNDITGTFRLGKDKLPMFADEHLGMDEATYKRTAFIGQLDVRIGSDGSSELAARLANVKGTGFEGLSFQRAETALSSALRNRIGTDRTRTQPLDKLEARLKQLGEEHARLASRQKQRQGLQEELADTKARFVMLKAQEQYLVKVGKLIDTRKRIDTGIKREANLREVAALLEETDRRLADAGEQRGATEGNSYTGRGGDISQGSGYYAAVSRNSRSFREGKAFSFGSAIPLFCIIAVMISGALFISALTVSGQPALSVQTLIYATVMLVFSIAGVITLIRRMKTVSSRSGDANTGDDLVKTGIDAVSERAEEFELLKKNALNSATLIYGNRVNSIEDVRRAVREVQAGIEELSLKLQQGLDEAQTAEQPGDGCFTRKDLDILIYDTDTASLEATVKSEMESIKEALQATALRQKYCEGMSDDDRENADDLQRVEEETVAVKEKIAYLRNKADAIKLAHEVLLEAGMEIRRDFAPGLNSSMSGIISGLSGQRYADLRGDGELLLKAAVPEHGEVKNVLVLSGGTADQMYLALRLAMTGLLTSGSESLPLIMDEVFSQFDDNRTALALKYLHDEYRESQIFIFTCKQREVELAKQIYGDRMNFVELGHEDFLQGCKV